MHCGMVDRLLPGGKKERVPWIYCDICGWGDRIVESIGAMDFCRRHKKDEIEKFIADKATGLKIGYFDKYPEHAS